MPLTDLTAPAVDSAIAEFRRVGRDAFLQTHGYGPAISYFVQVDGLLYDSKAIAGVAHGYARPDLGALPAEEFSGGEATVKRRLEDLGFTVVNQSQRNPSWVRDELILALDFYLAHRTRIPDKTSAEIVALSGDISVLGKRLNVASSNTFRNANGVYMKLMNFRRLDPAYTASGAVGLSRGGKADGDVWNEFAHDPVRLHAAADAIRKVLTADGPELTTKEDADEPGMAEAPEGRLLTRLHRYRERNRKLVQAKKAAVLKVHNFLQCEACGFDFKTRYGERGTGFAECHHVNPVSTLSPGQKTRIEDLAIVCANCHRMIHARAPWLSIQELRGILQ